MQLICAEATGRLEVQITLDSHLNSAEKTKRMQLVFAMADILGQESRRSLENACHTWALPQRRGGVFTTRRYTNPRLPFDNLYFTINMVAQQQKKNTIRNNNNLTKSTIFRTYN